MSEVIMSLPFGALVAATQPDELGKRVRPLSDAERGRGQKQAEHTFSHFPHALIAGAAGGLGYTAGARLAPRKYRMAGAILGSGAAALGASHFMYHPLGHKHAAGMSGGAFAGRMIGTATGLPYGGTFGHMVGASAAARSMNRRRKGSKAATKLAPIGFLAKADQKPQGEYGSKDEAGYADPGYQADHQPRYPLKKDGKLNPERIRAAWNYIARQKNADAYSSQHVAMIKARIVRAWKSAIDPKGPPSAQSR